MPDNRAFVQRAHDAFNRRDWDEFLSFFAEDAEWHTAPGAAVTSVLRGPAEIRRYLEEEWAGAFADFRSEVLDYQEVSGHPIVTIGLHGRGRESGLAVPAMTFHSVTTIRDGKFALMRDYFDWDDAVRVARG